jgi:uncharacterized membrane protein
MMFFIEKIFINVFDNADYLLASVIDIQRQENTGK